MARFIKKYSSIFEILEGYDYSCLFCLFSRVMRDQSLDILLRVYGIAT